MVTFLKQCRKFYNAQKSLNKPIKILLKNEEGPNKANAKAGFFILPRAESFSGLEKRGFKGLEGRRQTFSLSAK